MQIPLLCGDPETTPHKVETMLRSLFQILCGDPKTIPHKVELALRGRFQYFAGPRNNTPQSGDYAPIFIPNTLRGPKTIPTKWSLCSDLYFNYFAGTPVKLRKALPVIWQSLGHRSGCVFLPVLQPAGHRYFPSGSGSLTITAVPCPSSLSISIVPRAAQRAAA